MWAWDTMSPSEDRKRFADAVNAAMLRLAADPRTVFVGQSVRWGGAAMYASLEGVPMAQRMEMPVAEDFQLGFCLGLALMGRRPVCLFPRMDFLLLAANQLVNHLDKVTLFGWPAPPLIIRTTVGQKTPLDAGPQHTQNHTDAFRLMLSRIVVMHVRTPEEVEVAYEDYVWTSPWPRLIVENPL